MRPNPLYLLAFWAGLGGCASRASDAAPAPVDTGTTAMSVDTAAADTSVATPPITPSQSPAAIDTPPGGARPAESAPGQTPRVSAAEYEGWRQYSVNCARCHGQDVLPNPVAANLLISLAPGGPVESPAKFEQVVSNGRADRGMPAFKDVLSPEQIKAIYAYVKGRADKRIPPGRPSEPAG